MPTRAVSDSTEVAMGGQKKGHCPAGLDVKRCCSVWHEIFTILNEIWDFKITYSRVNKSFPKQSELECAIERGVQIQ